MYAKQKSKRQSDTRRPLKRTKPRGRIQDVEITAKFDAHVAEAFWLELRQVIKRHGAEIKEFWIR